ncbi:hypothetical protein [Chitinophaga rhizophila]|uniref:Uncharacterized protein n=1 Tax=Chitinophaga rhizophila TaxID=2866212 RepID=A0ABS7GBD7_9BACT|nr:hypothetical protein [Chitinophaga rhizophila]MBW8684986.1 hypothetical protein [Chitinophaga rhizophila]
MQEDVGSGATMDVLLTMLPAVENNFQENRISSQELMGNHLGKGSAVK